MAIEKNEKLIKNQHVNAYEQCSLDQADEDHSTKSHGKSICYKCSKSHHFKIVILR